MKFLLLLAAVMPAWSAQFYSSQWKVTVNPADLSVWAVLPDGRRLAISVPQGGPLNVAEHTAVTATLKGNALSVHITTDLPVLAFPLSGPPEEGISYIIPKAEGLLMDPRDRRWLSQAWPRELDLSDFSLPLWGVMGRGWTLTYLLENPFDNQFTFRDTGRGLAWSLQHEFKSNAKKKEFGIEIVLGPESPVEPARVYRQRLIDSGQFVSMQQKIAKTPDAEKLLGAPHAYLWSLANFKLERLRALGFDRFWLGISSLAQVRAAPQVVAEARKLGFLIGPYDSYDSIHKPGEPDTWETAQFDAELYDKGAIVGPDGKKMPGFKKKGYWLSSLAARPYVERRVARTFAEFPFNSFFMDCDAAGDLRDNYSTQFPATEADDMQARLSRMQWIVDRYHVPIGSEDGLWYAAPVIHFAHGMMTPVFGFFDARFKDRSSPWFLGGYWPPEAPAVFLKSVPLPDDYRAIYFDPRVRIPLFQAAFHDSLITTHHWSRPSLKFSNVRRVDELLELLYNVPPLYHLTPAELEKNATLLTRHYQFFSPLHRQTALLLMTSFTWLTPDRLVQKTVFGNSIEMIANFRDVPYQDGVEVPAQSIAARYLDSGKMVVY